jgi:hypothetical protein
MKDPILLIYSIVFYIIIGILSVFASENIADREWKENTLYDIVHENTPVWPSPDIPTYFVYFFIIYTIIRWSPVNPRIVALYFLSLSSILMFRLFTFSVTQTPPPRLKNDEWRIQHCRRNMFTHFGVNFKKVDTCIDNMFSGHATHIVAALAILFLFSKNILEKSLLGTFGLFSVITIITGRLHYTSDVLVATIISILTVFSLYKKLFTGANK